METKNEILYTHPKLGQIIFCKDKNGTAIFDENKIRGIMIKGLLYLSEKGMLTSDEKKNFQDKISNIDIEFNNDLNSEGYSCIYNTQTRDICAESCIFCPEYFTLGIERTIKTILQMLCDLIVNHMHADDKFNDKETFGDGHGEYWRQYARVLISDELADYYEDVYKAIFYLRNRLKNGYAEKFHEYYGDDWLFSVAYNYADLKME